MEKSTLMLIIFIWSLPGVVRLSAQSTTYFVAGINVSHFADENHEYRPGFNLGLAREWQKRPSVILGLEMPLSYKRGFYDNIKVAGTYDAICGFYKDLTYNLVLIEPTLYVKKLWRISQHKKVFITLGPGIQIGIADRSKIRRLDGIDNLEQREIFDHVGSIDPEPNIGFAVEGGIGISLNKLLITLCYTRAFHDIAEALHIRIGKPLHDFGLMFSIKL